MFKFKYIILFFLLVCTNYACQSYDVDTPHFNVSILDQQYKVGDSIIFYIEGNPDIIRESLEKNTDIVTVHFLKELRLN